MKTKPCVVGIGELLWDVLPEGKIPGGAPANFAYHVSQLGGRSLIISAIGNDPNGEEMLRWLAASDLETQFIQHNTFPTSTVEVTFPEPLHPQYLIREQVAWDYLQWSDDLESLAQEADCICVGTLAQRSPVAQKTIQRFIRASRNDCLRIFDVNLRSPFYSPANIIETLSLSSVLKLNEHEWPIVAKMLDINPMWESGIPELFAQSPLSNIAITRGDKGCVLADRNRIITRHSEEVAVMDSVGAGDAFTAALALGLVHHLDLESIQRLASEIAGFVCTQSGATPALPDSFQSFFSSSENKPRASKLLTT